MPSSAQELVSVISEVENERRLLAMRATEVGMTLDSAAQELRAKLALLVGARQREHQLKADLEAAHSELKATETHMDLAASAVTTAEREEPCLQVTANKEAASAIETLRKWEANARNLSLVVSRWCFDKGACPEAAAVDEVEREVGRALEEEQAVLSFIQFQRLHHQARSQNHLNGVATRAVGFGDAIAATTRLSEQLRVMREGADAALAEHSRHVSSIQREIDDLQIRLHELNEYVCAPTAASSCEEAASIE